MAEELPACAAIRLVSGDLIAGRRHSDCLYSLNTLGLSRVDSIQGFMTNQGRFVDRREALNLMELAEINSHDPAGYRGRELYSEDLY